MKCDYLKWALNDEFVLQKGMQQLYTLGDVFRQRYVVDSQFLQTDYDTSEVRLQIPV